MLPAPLLALFAIFAGKTYAAASSHHPSDALSDSRINQVKARLNDSAKYSWEIGTQTDALLEYDWPRLSVFGRRPLPPRLSPHGFQTSDIHAIVARVVAARPHGQKQFFNDTAVGDPASIGTASLLVDWTGPKQGESVYAIAAETQLDYLLHGAPRSNGTISQRFDQVQFWSDFIAMAPPFIAYYGGLYNNKSLLIEAYNQIRGYRAALSDSTGLWRHIVLGDNGTRDPSHWASGNGWATSGILRVLYTLRASVFAEQLESEQADLVKWTYEILDNAWANQQTNGTLLNHIDEAGSFVDSSGTALLAAATFRLAVFTSSPRNIKYAIKARKLIHDSIDKDGWLVNVVNPYDWHQAGQHSPEGQAFVLMMEAAYREWWDGVYD